MSGNIRHLIDDIPGLTPGIANFLTCRLSGDTSDQINRNIFQSFNYQLSTNFLEHTDPSKFLTGIGIRLTMSMLAIVSTVDFQNTYRVMEDLHHTIRGTEVSELSVMRVLVRLASYAVRYPNRASKESQEFTKICLARLIIPGAVSPACTATEHLLWNYGNIRLSGASHEVACGLMLPRQVQAALFLQDLQFFLDEVRTVYWVGFQGDRSALHNILFIFTQAFPTLTEEWLSNQPDFIQFEQSLQLHSLFGIILMLMGHFQKGNLDSFGRAIRLAVNDLEGALDTIKKELSMATLYGKLKWEGPTNASTAFGPCLGYLKENLFILKRQANRVSE